MITIYKYPLSPMADEMKISMPAGAQPLSCGTDPVGIPCIWAMVDTDSELEDVTVRCIGTGWDVSKLLDNGLQFLGTINDGPFMWHVFMEG